jgi:hypothetical protein
MAWKRWLVDLRRQLIVEPLKMRSDGNLGAPLGKTIAWIFDHAIGGGQADFDQPIANLSSRDRVMLYALLNQKSHIDELIHAFDLFLPRTQLAEGTTVVDIGCGPFTAGLALANVVGNVAAYRYFGIDHSSAMRALGQEFADWVRQADELHECTSVSFHSDLARVDFGAKRSAERTLFVLSYLLASDSVDPAALVNVINSTASRIGWGPVYVLYTNSATDYNRRHFPDFQAGMEAVGFQLDQPAEVEIFRDFRGRERHIHYALFLRNGRRLVPIEEFQL